MKTLLSTKALLAALVLSSAVQAADDKVNVNVLNALVGKIVQETLKEHRSEPNPIFKALELKLDEKETDLNSEDSIKAKLTFSATAEKTRWYAGDTKLSLSLGGGADRAKAEAWLDLAGSLETDTPSLARFAAREIKPEFCNPRNEKPGTEAIVKEVCAEFTKLESVTEVGPLFASLQKIAELQAKYSAVEIADAEARLAKAPQNQKQWIQNEVDRAKASQQLAQQIATELKNATVTAKSAHVRVKSMKLSKYAEAKDLDLYLDKTKFEISVRFTGFDLSKKEIDGYFEMKPLIQEEILKLQNNDPKSVAQVRATLGWLLKASKELLTEDKK